MSSHRAKAVFTTDGSSVTLSGFDVTTSTMTVTSQDGKKHNNNDDESVTDKNVESQWFIALMVIIGVGLLIAAVGLVRRQRRLANEASGSQTGNPLLGV